MDVFDLDQSLVDDYQRFARSFTTIRARDIRDQVEAFYASGRFWPEPLVTINPHFAKGDRVDQLADAGILAHETALVFRANGAPLRLHRHQQQAIVKASGGSSIVVT